MDPTSQNKRLFPFVWPWKGANNENVSLSKLVRLKPFTIFYLITIWLIVVVLGFASTRARDCGVSWEMSIYCEYAFWVKDLTEKPIHLVLRNLITTSFLHNGLDHILFVSVIGFLLIVQSHEAIFGWKRTALIFFSSYLTVAPFWAGFYTVGTEIYPGNEFMLFAFKRNWMGGSIGMFQVYGALIPQSRKPLVLLAIPIAFEIFNLVLGIDLHISLMHWLAVFIGLGISLLFSKAKKGVGNS
ncbi:hypothetical protein [Ekhidna sp.]|uniref:hypothetical protein n=1 Tax=Ekhidna sp. TaxID=2608089 RepID=UPI003C7A40AD